MKLQRVSLGHGGAPTLGTLESRDHVFHCVTLERSADGDHPCIPAGRYQVVLDMHHPGSEHAYACPELRGVPGRSEIQIHIANRAGQLLGCIAVGERVAADHLGVEYSGAAFERLMTYLEGTFPFELEIVDPLVAPVAS